MSRPEVGRLALLDQLEAELMPGVDEIVAIVQKGAAQRGDQQAAADLCALLSTWPSHYVAALCSMAALRLARLEGDVR